MKKTLMVLLIFMCIFSNFRDVHAESVQDILSKEHTRDDFITLLKLVETEFPVDVRYKDISSVLTWANTYSHSNFNETNDYNTLYNTLFPFYIAAQWYGDDFWNSFRNISKKDLPVYLAGTDGYSFVEGLAVWMGNNKELFVIVSPDTMEFSGHVAAHELMHVAIYNIMLNENNTYQKYVEEWKTTMPNECLQLYENNQEYYSACEIYFASGYGTTSFDEDTAEIATIMYKNDIQEFGNNSNIDKISSTLAKKVKMEVDYFNISRTVGNLADIRGNNDAQNNPLSAYSNMDMIVYENSRVTSIKDAENGFVVEGYMFEKGADCIYNDSRNWREIVFVNTEDVSVSKSYRKQVNALYNTWLNNNMNATLNGRFKLNYTNYRVTVNKNDINSYVGNIPHQRMAQGSYYVYMRISNGETSYLFPLRDATLSDGTNMENSGTLPVGFSVSNDGYRNLIYTID